MFVLFCLAGFSVLATIDNLIGAISSWLRNGSIRYDENTATFGDSISANN